jgi:hypothetical protein
MKKISFILLFILLSLCFKVQGQIGITDYSFFALAVNTSQNHLFSGEMKVFLNRNIEDILFELDGFFNFKPREYHRFSVGIGANVGPFIEGDPLLALTIPSSLEIYPLKDFKKISILFELAPEIYIEGEVNIRLLWGIRYSFGKSK